MKRLIGIAIVLFLTTSLYSQATKKSFGGKMFAIKTDLLSPFYNTFGIEVEKNIGPVVLVARAGVNDPGLVKEKIQIPGYYFTFGPKFYLLKEKRLQMKGLALHPEFIYSFWNDKEAEGKGLVKRTTFSVGGIVNLSYQLLLFDHLVIEPKIGVGYIPTWEVEHFVSDVSNPGLPKTSPEIIDYESNLFRFTHYSFPKNFAVSANIMFGIRF